MVFHGSNGLISAKRQTDRRIQTPTQSWTGDFFCPMIISSETSVFNLTTYPWERQGKVVKNYKVKGCLHSPLSDNTEHAKFDPWKHVPIF